MNSPILIPELKEILQVSWPGGNQNIWNVSPPIFNMSIRKLSRLVKTQIRNIRVKILQKDIYSGCHKYIPFGPGC